MRTLAGALVEQGPMPDTISRRMQARKDLHRLIDELSESDLQVAARLLSALRTTEDPVLRALMTAPPDDENLDDDLDGGLGEARAEAREGRFIDHDELKRELDLS